MLILVNENQLDEWVRANAEDAQGVIVELIWRLVAASCPNPRERRFPLGDSTNQHGPDGILDTSIGLDPYVPDGRSFWEIGTGLQANSKATNDYRDLTRAVPENIRYETNFIFVTPLSGRRTWQYTWKEDAQATWLQERRDKHDWKDVRIIDGTTLIDWVHHFPAVELWLAHRMYGFSEQEIEIPEQRWALLRSFGEPPPLIPAVFLANRDETCRKLKDVFDGTTKQLKLATHFPDQVIDFACAYLVSLEDESRIDVAGRCLILSGVDTWNKVCDQTRDFVLIADPALDLSGDAGTKLIQKARKAGHGVIFGGPHGGLPDPASATLPIPDSHQIREALEKAGYSEQRARTLASRCDGNLGSLLRLLQNLSVLPEWSQRSDAAELTIAEMLGSWNDASAADRAVAENLMGKAYGGWIGKMREVALDPGTPLIHYDGNWKFIARYEGWYALGPRIFDHQLDKLSDAAVFVLTENDPKFELPPEQRYAASVFGKILKCSYLLRRGLAESLALLGSHPNALTSSTRGKAESTAILAVRNILSNADWVRWASLNELLPFLAEAAPGEFLYAVEKALRSEPCPFDMLFAQESAGVMGASYLSGLLWALESLAWDTDHLIRVVTILGELAAHDPGGQWSNRPANSLTAILLPWLPQTCAPIAKRLAAVKALLAESPDVGWKLLLTLLPQPHSFSIGTYRPAWRTTIPNDWQQGVTSREYWLQLSSYLEYAIAGASADGSKLATLVAYLPDLPQPAHDQLLEYLASDAIMTMPETIRLHIWNELDALARKQRVFTDAERAMKPEQVKKIVSIAEQLAPTNPFYRHQRLFSETDSELYVERGNYEDQSRDLDLRRQKAIEELASEGSIELVLEFAKTVQSPWRVGIAYGSVALEDVDAMALPALLDSDNQSIALFAGGFVLGRFRSQGWRWVDGIVMSRWTPPQVGQFLSFLPFAQDTWDRARLFLGQDESPYWTKTTAYPYEEKNGLDFAARQLIYYGRPHAALRCLHKMLLDELSLDTDTAVQALLRAIESSESPRSLDGFVIVEIIQALQNDPSTSPDDLCRVEWAFLPLLDERSKASPRSLERRLGVEPGFFCEVVRLVFRSKKQERSSGELTDERRIMATNAYHLLSRWRIPPGLRADGGYDGNELYRWLEAVKDECAETGHLEIALEMAGQVLVHVPPDPDGLWIHRAAAEALNARDADHMRIGYSIKLYNLRGGHWVDPTGKPERELAAKYQEQAETVDVAGYPRLAATLRELADTYTLEAEKVLLMDLFNE